MIAHPNRKKIIVSSQLSFTLQQIRDAGPCLDGWTKLRKSLPAKSPLSLKVSLGDVARSNGAADALWCVRVLDWSDISTRRLVIAGAVLPGVSRASVYTQDKRVHDCIASLTRWCEGADVNLNEAAEAAAWAAEAAATATAAAWAAEAASWAAWAARAAWAASWAAWAARAAAEAAEVEELGLQRMDIITAFPPLR